MTRYRPLVAYLILVLLIGLAFWQVSEVAAQVEANAVARTDLREREAILRANVLCVAANELRIEIREFLDAHSSGDYGDSFSEEECPPPPTDDFYEDRIEHELPEEPPGDSDVRDETEDE